MTSHPVVRAIRPLVEAIGATLVPLGSHRSSDVVISWEGEPVVAVRVHLEDTLEGMIASVQDELGGELADLERHEKQAAIRLLDERGAFLLRKSIDDVADAMGVSRITIYNYLNAMRETR